MLDKHVGALGKQPAALAHALLLDGALLGVEAEAARALPPDALRLEQERRELDPQKVSLARCP